MRKTLIIAIFFAFLTSSAYGNWYQNNSGTSWSTNSGVRNCSTDGDSGDPIRVANNNNTGLTPENVQTNIGGGGTLRCLYWDATTPTISYLNHTNNWTNITSQTVTFSLNDSGRSGLSQYTLQRRVYNGGWGGWSNISGHTNQSISGNSHSGSYPYTGVNGRRYQYRIQVRDAAGNISAWTNSGETTMVETVIPTVPSLNHTNGWTNVTSQTTAFSLSDSGGSGLSQYTLQRRVYNGGWGGWSNISGHTNQSISGNSHSGSYPYTGVNGRRYQYRIQVRDAAGNISAWTNSGETTMVDTTTPGNPNITANDRSHDVWSNDISTTLTSTPDTVGQVSPRTNYFCRDYSLTHSVISPGCTPTNANQAAAWETTGLSDATYYYRSRTCTAAGNCSGVSTFIVKIDTVYPISTDISNSLPLNNTNLLAVNSQNISLSVAVNGGAPITQVRGYFENDVTINSYLPTPYTSTSGNFTHNYDIRDIDRSRDANGSRQYSLKITRICDDAGNCTYQGDNSGNSVGIRNFVFNVYANTTSITSSTVTNELSGVIIADGGTRNLTINLRDQYGNDIVPASGISRSIDVNVRGNNALRRDQYLNTGNDSALYVDTDTTPLPISTTAVRVLNSRSSSNGNYTIPFYVYAPTNNVDDLMPGYADIQLQYDVNGSIGVSGDTPQNQSIVGTSTIIQAQPLYATTISGEIVTQGFIEGANQNMNIGITKASSTVTNSDSLRAEFGDVSGGNNIVNTRYGFSINGISLPNEGGQVAWGNTQQLSSSLNNLNNRTTLMIQDTPVVNQTYSYLASIVKYNIGTKTIVYPGDIVGKNNYHGTAGTSNSYQEGIKIIGNTSSSNTGALTVDQFTDDIRVLGKLTKSTFRQDIDKKAFSVTRNVTAKTGGPLSLSSVDMNASQWDATKYDVGNAGSRGTALFGESVLYYGDGNLVTINGATNIEGEKTIVVENGDLYIAGDIENTDNDGILGIIVIDGDILIDTAVTDIHAILYTNQSVFSSTNGSDKLDGTALASDLENQLYIRGSLFSENTIGGSRKSPPECPYYINSGCTQSVAQGYDLNYLRRYYRYDSDADGTIDSESGAQSRANGQSGFEDFPITIDYNPSIQQTPPPFFD